MFRRYFTCVSLVSLSFAFPVFAEQPAAVTPPTTQPATKEQRIAKLINDLAAENFRTRESASQELLKLGPEALPALKEALKNEDPSIKSYAEYLVPRIENKSRPQRTRQPQWQGFRGPLVGPRMGGAIHQRMMTSSDHNGVKDITVREDGREIVSIHEDNTGIRMKVLEQQDGKEAEKEYTAKNLEELRKDHPAAAEVYERYVGRGRRGRVNAFLPGIIGGAGGIGALIDGQIPEDQRQLVEEQMKHVEEVQKEVQEQMKELRDQLRVQTDQIRQQMKEDIERARRQLDDE